MTAALALFLAIGSCSTATADISPEEVQLATLVNEWRMTNLGAPPMTLSGPANRAAAWFATEMAAGRYGFGGDAHRDQYGRLWNDRLIDCGYPLPWANGSGEALAFASTPAEALAAMTAGGHSNGVNAPVAWQCFGVARSGNAFVVVTAQYSSTACPEPVQPAPPPKVITRRLRVYGLARD
jgi:hypothetical protein